MKKWNLKPLQIVAAAAILLLLVILVIVSRTKAAREGEEPAEEYDYSVTEQVLADEVIVYLENAAGLSERVSGKTANEAVESYRLILQSNVDVVNDDHTQAIQDRIKKVLTEYVEEDAALSEEDIPALSAGVAEIVWRSILSQIESVTDNVEESEYFYLAESMQQQIQDLEDRKMKVSIRADISNSTDLTPDELLSVLEGMTDEEIGALAKSLGLSFDELHQLLENGENGSGNVGDKELEEMLTKLKKELENEFDKKLEKEIANGANGVNGSNGTSAQAYDGKNGQGGRNGTDGKDGQDGKDGKDGKAGRDGDSIYIMYAETATGENMTKTPTSTTKYMGTYVGQIESANAADYTWTRYSDATISYSDGTLYITQ